MEGRWAIGSLIGWIIAGWVCRVVCTCSCACVGRFASALRRNNDRTHVPRHLSRFPKGSGVCKKNAHVFVCSICAGTPPCPPNLTLLFGHGVLGVRNKRPFLYGVVSGFSILNCGGQGGSDLGNPSANKTGVYFAHPGNMHCID